MRLRYRLARLLLGYRPHRLPETDGVSIVIRDGGGTVTMEARTFTMEQHIEPVARDADALAWPPAPRRSGTFSGTL